MAEFPALPFWTDAYFGDTTHLTTIEHGAFLLLLFTAWRSKDRLLPDDDARLARYTRLSKRQWLRIRPTIEEFFLVENGVWSNARLHDEYDAVKRQVQQRSDAGKASALKRKHRGATGVATGEHGRSTPTPTPTPTIETTNVVSSECPDLEDRVSQWNAFAERHGLASVRRLTTARKQRLRKISDAEWLECLQRIERSEFLLGRINGRDWRANLDFVLQESSRMKILEGAYGGDPPARGGFVSNRQQAAQDDEDLKRELEKIRERARQAELDAGGNVQSRVDGAEAAAGHDGAMGDLLRGGPETG